MCVSVNVEVSMLECSIQLLTQVPVLYSIPSLFLLSLHLLKNQQHQTLHVTRHFGSWLNNECFANAALKSDIALPQ